MKNIKAVKLILIVFFLLASSLACANSANSNSGVLVEPAPNEADSNSEENVAEDAPEESAPAFFAVGDLVETSDEMIALTSVELQGNLLIATFKVKNTSSSELSLSTLLSFSAKNDQSELLEEDIFDCEPSLGGTVVSGDVVTGKICWKGGSFPARLYYDPNLFGSGTVVWDVPEAASINVTLEPDELTSYVVGDVIEIKDQTISLVEVTVVNGRLTATFLVENTGTDELNLSSLLSFDTRGSEGASLDMDIFDCSPGLDGTVVAGDKLRGSICWTGASFPLTIYYDVSLFGSGTVVWEINE